MNFTKTVLTSAVAAACLTAAPAFAKMTDAEVARLGKDLEEKKGELVAALAGLSPGARPPG